MTIEFPLQPVNIWIFEEVFGDFWWVCAKVIRIWPEFTCLRVFEIIFENPETRRVKTGLGPCGLGFWAGLGPCALFRLVYFNIPQCAGRRQKFSIHWHTQYRLSNFRLCVTSKGIEFSAFASISRYSSCKFEKLAPQKRKYQLCSNHLLVQNDGRSIGFSPGEKRV